MDDEQLKWVWLRRSPRGRFQPLGVVLGGLAGSIWFKQQKHLGRIVLALRDTLPQGLLDHLAVDGFRRNTLHIRVDSAAHRYELEAVKEQLLAELNVQVSGVFIRDIRFTLGQLEESEPPRPRPTAQDMELQ